MSGFIMKYFFKRNMPDLKFGTNPYFDAESVKHHGRKKFKEISTAISAHDAKILKKARKRAYHLDESIQCCCCSLRVGWAAIIGLIPVLGDIIDAYLAMRIVQTASKIEGGLPESVKSAMMANIIVDFGVGLIPFVGDLADMLYKCNTRNLQLLEKHLLKKAATNAGSEAGHETVNNHHTTGAVHPHGAQAPQVV